MIEILNGFPNLAGDDVRKMLIDIAKHQPKAIYDANRRLNPEKKPAEDWKVEAIKILNMGGQYAKLNAIKHCRSMTGMSLADANNAVEAL